MILGVLLVALLLVCALLMGFSFWLDYRLKIKRLAGTPAAKQLERSVAASEKKILGQLADLERRVGNIEEWTQGA